MFIYHRTYTYIFLIICREVSDLKAVGDPRVVSDQKVDLREAKV